jgi:hypothetical protein
VGNKNIETCETNMTVNGTWLARRQKSAKGKNKGEENIETVEQNMTAKENKGYREEQIESKRNNNIRGIKM